MDAGDEGEAIAALGRVLGLTVVGLSVFDKDFEEWLSWPRVR